MPFLSPFSQLFTSSTREAHTATVYPPSQSISLSIEAISGITGSVSIACWLVVFTPQIIENFKRGSAEGLSLTFLILWLLGDVFNVLGGILQGVIPTMLILAIYYTFADIVLLLQCLYYRYWTAKSTPQISHQHDNRPPTADVDADEESPLLSRTISDYVAHERRGSLRILAESAHHLSPANPLHDPPASPTESVTKLYTNGVHTNGSHTNGSHTNGSGSNNVDAVSSLRHAQEFGNSSHSHSRQENGVSTVSGSDNGNGGTLKSISRDVIAVSLVIFAGIAGWYLTPSSHPSPPSEDPHIPERHPLEFSFYGQVFGYLCAVLYLGSRIPQIILNYQRKSCEGVAFLFFLFACLGNITYVISILAYRPGKVEDGEGYWRYIAVNASWLLGSFGTLGLDFVIFVQFFMYRNDFGDIPESAIVSDEEDGFHTNGANRGVEDDEVTIRPE
ncbi:hypothetical protein ABW19_dt0201691 [Dactylella cylindrospora]|nr:hypothetical protein ABW19_dt0201691 [Dactylella cylindrospora]